MFDDIVVGSGAAGAVVAARLSEDATRTVLLLEAGPDYASLGLLPTPLKERRAPSLGGWDWGFEAETLPGRRAALPRGRVVGGSSAVNGAVALRGLPQDHDEWAALGNAGWSWSEVLPFYRKLEDDQDFATALHGAGGPIPIRRSSPRELSSFHRAFIESAAELGFARQHDFNAPAADGVGAVPLNIRGELRVSTAIGYLLPARSRPNLTIRGDALVDRVEFDGDKAVGVRVLAADSSENISGRRVTLAAGAIGTPAILLRSGLGPPESASAFGVGVRADLPGVGANLADHPGFLTCLVPRPGAFDAAAPSFQSLLRFAAPAPSEFGDLQIIANGRADFTTQADRAAAVRAGKGFTLGAILNRPLSRGRVTLRSVDARVAPHIELNFFEQDDDLRRLLACVRVAVDIARQQPLAELVERVALPTELDLSSDDRLGEAIRRWASTAHHVSGTARMGPDGDVAAVVDPSGLVRGVRQLVVADASIMPTIPRANTHLACVMIGERIAHWMR